MMKYLMMLILFLPIVGQANELNEYFPKGKFSSDDTWLDNYAINILSTELISMKEPTLWEMSKANQKSEVYRLFIKRSFLDAVCVRIEINNSDFVKIYKKVFRQNQEDKKGYSGELIVNEEKSISKEDILSFLRQMDNIKFWDLQPTDFPRSHVVDGFVVTGSFDGTSWIFEGVKDCKYQLIDIPLPNYGSDDLNKIVIELGKSFLAIADLKVDPLY